MDRSRVQRQAHIVQQQSGLPDPEPLRDCRSSCRHRPPHSTRLLPRTDLRERLRSNSAAGFMSTISFLPFTARVATGSDVQMCSSSLPLRRTAASDPPRGEFAWQGSLPQIDASAKSFNEGSLMWHAARSSPGRFQRPGFAPPFRRTRTPGGDGCHFGSSASVGSASTRCACRSVPSVVIRSANRPI